MAAAKAAFTQAHSLVLATAGVMLSAAGRRDLAQLATDEAADGAIAVATGPSPRGALAGRGLSLLTPRR